MDRSTVYFCAECDRELDSTDELENKFRCPIDGSRLFRLPDGLGSGTVIDGRYTLVKPLGQGGMGVVFAAEHQATGQAVAVKLISVVGDDDISVRRFFREAKASTRINHPAVVEVFDFGQTPDGRPYMAMEILEGEPLDEMLEREGALEASRALHIAAEITSALAASHELRILHRDLKPSNVMIRRDEGVERVKVLDFGLAKAVQDDTGELGTVTATGALVGTPQYMSPEQFRCADLAPATDLYSLGCVLYEMLTGRHPFPSESIFGQMQAHVMKEPTPLSEVAPQMEIPTEVEQLCLQLLAKDEDERGPEAPVLARRLRQLADAYGATGKTAFGEDQRRPPESREFAKRTLAATVPSLEAMESAELERFRPGLVGRKQTRGFLQEILKQALDSGDPAVISMEGPGGVGKSTLLRWYETRAEQSGYRVVRGFHAEGHLGPLAALKQALEELLGVVGEPWEAIDTRLDEITEERGDAEEGHTGLTRSQRSRLRQFLRPQVGETGERTDFAAQDRAILYETLMRVIRWSVKDEPTLIVMDDLRDDRPFDDEFNSRLAMHLAEMKEPLLVAMSIRTGNAAAQSDGDGPQMTETIASSLAVTLREQFYRLEVRPLGDDDVQTLVKRALPGISTDAASQIAELAGGNPLYTLQLLRNMVAEGSLRRETGGWELVGTPTLPEDLDGVLDARLRRLRDREGEQDLLVRAALIGARVPLELLEEILERESNFDLLDEMDELLDRLIDDGWLRDAESWDEEAVVFEHGFVHRALVERYGSKRAARKIHRVIAEALEIYYADEIEPQASRIAEHFLAGRKQGRALPYLIQAARAAERRYAVDDAIDFWRRAHDSLRRARANDQTSSSVRRGLARFLIQTGKYDAAADILDELGDDAKAMALRADLAEACAELDGARQYYELAAQAAIQQGLTKLALRISVRTAEIDQKACDYDSATRRLKEVLHRPEAGASSRVRGVALNSLAMNLQHLGDFQASLESLEEAESVWRQLEDDVELGRCLYTRGSLHWNLSEFEQALEAYGEAVPLLERAGHRRGLGHCLRMAGATAQELGRLDDALAYCHRAKDVFERIDDRRGLQHVALCFADVHVARREYQEALQHAEYALEMARNLRDEQARFIGLVTLGEVHLASQDFSSSICAFESALEVNDSSEQPKQQQAHACEKFGLALHLDGQPKRAGEYFEQALATYREIGNKQAATAIERKLEELQSQQPQMEE